jgi:hypothetical protein
MRKPSPALLVACLALLAALAGTSFASGTASVNPTVYSAQLNVGANSPGSIVVRCPAGKFATGGGGYLGGQQSADDHLIDSEPGRVGTPAQNGFVPITGGRATGWHVTIYNPNADTRLATAFVVCA